MSNIKGMLFIILSSASFGVMPILVKLAYSKGATTYDVLFLRFAFAAVMLFYYLIKNRISFRLSKGQFARIIPLGVFGYSATALCLFKSYNYISAGLSTMILYLYPVIVTLVSFFLYKEKIDTRKFISLLVSSVGVYLLVAGKGTSFNATGIFFAFLSAIFYSIYVLGASNEEIKKVNSYVMTFYVSAVSAVAIMLSGIAAGSLELKIEFYSLICILLIAFISTVFALMAFLEGVRLVGPSKASILSTLEPIITFLLGITVLGETMEVRTAVGGILVISSIIILTVKNIKISKKLKWNFLDRI